MAPVVMAAAAVAGVGLMADQGRRAANTAEDAANTQQTQADRAYQQQQQAMQAQIDQNNEAMKQQQQAYDTQLAQARDAAKQQQDQFDKTFKQAQADSASQATQAAAQLSNAQQQFKLQEESMNKANARQPDLAVIDAKNRQAARTGQGGTMLTGSAGVDPGKLLLGKTSLLGS